jgi:hypothetical protein
MKIEQILIVGNELITELLACEIQLLIKAIPNNKMRLVSVCRGYNYYVVMDKYEDT